MRVSELYPHHHPPRRINDDTFYVDLRKRTEAIFTTSANSVLNNLRYLHEKEITKENVTTEMQLRLKKD